jgi:Ca2+:H+ antiporter
MLPADQAHLSDISLEYSVLMLVVYGLSLLFSLITHRGYYQGQKAVGEEHEREAHWSVTKSLLVLLGATVCVGLLAEFMIGSVHEASHNLGLSDVFVGVIVVAIVGNAAEHSTAIIMAWRNRMDLALAIAVGSSIQIALFVAPALVLFSHAVGPRMNLVFSMPEMVAVFVCVWVISQIAVDGESNWLEGVLMLSVYIMLGLLFFYLPGGQPAPAP